MIIWHPSNFERVAYPLFLLRTLGNSKFGRIMLLGMSVWLKERIQN